MKKYKFTIKGNHNDKSDNPVPYTRTTQRSKKTKKYQKYTEWKSYVRKVFTDSVKDPSKYYRNELQYGAPLLIPEGMKARLNVMIYFSKLNHGDPDNVAKGIADSLFVNDKYMASSCDFAYDEHNPRCEVEISYEKI